MWFSDKGLFFGPTLLNIFQTKHTCDYVILTRWVKSTSCVSDLPPPDAPDAPIADEAALGEIYEELEHEVDARPEVDDDDAERRNHTQEHGEHLLSHIIDEVLKGHLSADLLMHWIEQLKDALKHGEISHERLEEFEEELKDDLAGTVYYETCCNFGRW